MKRRTSGVRMRFIEIERWEHEGGKAKPSSEGIFAIVRR
jgi:hypothetical protein